MRGTSISALLLSRDFAWRMLTLGAAAVLSGTACHRNPVNVRSSVAGPPEQHCWWAAYRTTLPPDSVAARFERALTSIGFSGGRVGSLADTAWAQAGPTALASPELGTYAARVVAIRMRDSTHFRVFIAGDTTDAGKLIGMCGEIMRRAAFHAAVPSQEESDDSTPRWRRRPSGSDKWP